MDYLLERVLYLLVHNSLAYTESPYTASIAPLTISKFCQCIRKINKINRLNIIEKGTIPESEVKLVTAWNFPQEKKVGRKNGNSLSV